MAIVAAPPIKVNDRKDVPQVTRFQGRRRTKMSHSDVLCRSTTKLTPDLTAVLQSRAQRHCCHRENAVPIPGEFNYKVSVSEQN